MPSCACVSTSMPSGASRRWNSRSLPGLLEAMTSLFILKKPQSRTTKTTKIKHLICKDVRFPGDGAALFDSRNIFMPFVCFVVNGIPGSLRQCRALFFDQLHDAGLRELQQLVHLGAKIGRAHV